VSISLGLAGTSSAFQSMDLCETSSTIRCWLVSTRERCHIEGPFREGRRLQKK
jgi:hypothetical protein